MKSQIVQEVKPPSVFCGVDIAKKTFAAAIDHDNPRAVVSAVFPNDQSGFARFLDWLFARMPDGAVARISMEATGIYWLCLAMRLHNEPRLVVCVHNPALIKKYIGSFGVRAKTDAIDAAMIARFARERARVAWVPAGEARARLAALARAYDDLMLAQNAFLTRSQQSQHKEADAHYRAVLRTLEDELEALAREMKSLVAADPVLSGQSALLQSVPGIAELSAAQILAEMPRELVGDPRAMSAYAGIVPAVEQSGTSINRSKLSRQGNPHLRKRIFRAATSASRWCPELRAFRERLIAKGKHKMRAIMAVAHKLLRILCSMMAHNTVFEPSKLLPVT